MSIVRFAAPVALAILLGTTALTHATTPAGARTRVEHHLRHIERLSGHFETLLSVERDVPRRQTEIALPQ
jgi:hypothetical protein